MDDHQTVQQNKGNGDIRKKILTMNPIIRRAQKKKTNTFLKFRVHGNQTCVKKGVTPRAESWLHRNAVTP
jgi:hypothetical protein